MHYTPLFMVRIQHAYFLDSGIVEFNNLPDDEKENLNNKYRVNDFFKIIPTEATKKLIRDRRLILKYSNDGIVILTSTADETTPLIPLDTNTTFRFELYKSDPLFDNYTNIESGRNNNKIYNIFKDLNGNIPSNPIVIDINNTLEDAVDSRELVHKNSVAEYIANPNESLFSISGIHSDDIATPESVELLNTFIKKRKQKGFLGYLIIKTNTILTDIPQLILKLENRNTFWKYILSDGVEFTTSNPQPLTKNGFVEIGVSEFNTTPPSSIHFSNPTADMIVVDINNNKTYSEIFI